MKHINAITIICISAAVLFVIILTFIPQALLLSPNENRYEAKYFDPDTVNTVSINISTENWDDMLKNPTEEEWHQADITINGDKYPGVGIRTKGMTSLSQVASSDSNRYSFKLKSDEYVNGQTFDGLNKFVLNNNYQDPTYMREYLAYYLLTALGVPTPLYSYAAVYINGEYWGLYLMVEEPEEDFLLRTMGSDYGILYKPESMGNMGGGKNGDKMPEGFGDEQLQMFAQLTDEERNEMMKQFQGGNFGGMQNLQGGFGNMTAGRNQTNRGFNGPGGFGGGGQGGQGGPGGFGGPGGGGGPGGFGGGTDLVYTDDNVSSYSKIFDGLVNGKLKNADKTRLIAALKNLKEGKDLDSTVDVDEVLRYFAVNTALVNLDSYVSSLQHNYLLYEKDGQLSMFPWDWNLAFGAFQAGASDAVNFPIDTPLTQGLNLSDRPMIGSLLSNDTYKQRYHEIMAELSSKYLGDALIAKIDKTDALIREYVRNDPTAFYTFEEYEAAVKNMKQYVTLRTQSIEGQLNGTRPSTWDAMTANPDKLIDTSNLTFNSGFGGGGPGGFGGGGRNNRGGNTTTQFPGFNAGTMPGGMDMSQMQNMFNGQGGTMQQMNLTQGGMMPGGMDMSQMQNMFNGQNGNLPQMNFNQGGMMPSGNMQMQNQMPGQNGGAPPQMPAV